MVNRSMTYDPSEEDDVSLRIKQIIGGPRELGSSDHKNGEKKSPSSKLEYRLITEKEIHSRFPIINGLIAIYAEYLGDPNTYKTSRFRSLGTHYSDTQSISDRSTRMKLAEAEVEKYILRLLKTLGHKIIPRPEDRSHRYLPGIYLKDPSKFNKDLIDLIIKDLGERPENKEIKESSTHDDSLKVRPNANTIYIPKDTLVDKIMNYYHSISVRDTP